MDEPTRIEGPTPNGGAYAIAYRRQEGEFVAIEIVEFDAADQVIMRTYGRAGARSG